MVTLTSVLAATFNLPESAITDDLEYRSIPEWDSLAHVELMVALEKAFGIEINNDIVLSLSSVSAIKRHIESGAREDTPRESIVAEVPAHGGDAQPSKRPVERGLKKIFFDHTKITFIDRTGQDLIYRGYSIHDLAENSNFEETAYLVLFGDLPTSLELNKFDSDLKNAREISPNILRLIADLKHLQPMQCLRTVVSSMTSTASSKQTSHQSALKDGIDLIAQIPTIVAAHHRLRIGQKAVPPSKTISHAANFIYMLFGRNPTSQEIRYLDIDLVLHADHSSTPSTFAARLAAGAEADIFAAFTSAIATLGGDLHGKAPENIIGMLYEIGSPENAAEFVHRKRNAKEPIMGFGHRIYRTEDPRARHLRKGALQLSQEEKNKNLFAVAEALVEIMKPYAKHGLSINDDYYSSIVLHFLGIPADLFGSIAAMSRSVGLVAHVLEQYSNNIMMAPRLKYSGRIKSVYVPIGQRD